jgi:hypothetical protein
MAAGLRVVTPEKLIQGERTADAATVAAQDAANENSRLSTSLAGFVDGEFQRMVRHRDGSNGWSDRLVAAMRVFNGEYDIQKLHEIKKFGGSDIYARLIATKCRGASSLLRDIYVNVDKPWALQPTPDPKLPEDVIADVTNLVQVEAETMTRLGQPPSPEMIRDRMTALMAAARRAGIKKARAESEIAFHKLDDILVEGGFYDALDEALVDIPLFPFACIKGPVVRITPRVTWVDGRAVIENRPVMFWNRVSPFDIWWTPGVSKIEDAAVIEKSRITRAEINQLIGLPGYNEAALREVLKWYGRSGYVEVSPSSETERAQMEGRESPQMNESGMLDMLEYHGYVQGDLLLEYGMTPEQIPDELKDYFVDIFKIGRYIIKVQLSPSLKKRAPYYITSLGTTPCRRSASSMSTAMRRSCSVFMRNLRRLLMSLAPSPATSRGPTVWAELVVRLLVWRCLWATPPKSYKRSPPT